MTKQLWWQLEAITLQREAKHLEIVMFQQRLHEVLAVSLQLKATLTNHKQTSAINKSKTTENCSRLVHKILSSFLQLGLYLVFISSWLFSNMWPLGKTSKEKKCVQLLKCWNVFKRKTVLSPSEQKLGRKRGEGWRKFESLFLAQVSTFLAMPVIPCESVTRSVVVLNYHCFEAFELKHKWACFSYASTSGPYPCK